MQCVPVQHSSTAEHSARRAQELAGADRCRSPQASLRKQKLVLPSTYGHSMSIPLIQVASLLIMLDLQVPQHSALSAGRSPTQMCMLPTTTAVITTV